jgi:hypothetical protein
METQKYICLKIWSVNPSGIRNITHLLEPWLHHGFVFPSPIFRQKTEKYDLNTREVRYFWILVRQDAAQPTSKIIKKILIDKLPSNVDFSIEIENEGIVFTSDV